MTRPDGPNGHAGVHRSIEIDRPGPGSHRTTLVIDGVPVDTLADLPPARNGLLFVGLQPSAASVAAGHYHQGDAGRSFWGRLVTAGIVPPHTPFPTADDALVVAGHGITDLMTRPDLGAPASADVAVHDADLTAGVGRLWQKVALWRPGAVVFLNERAASIVAGRRVTVPWGTLHDVALAGRPCFLMPDPYAPRDQVDAGLNFLRNLSMALPD